MEPPLIALILIEAATIPLPPPDSWIRISRNPALSHSFESVDILYSKGSSDPAGFDLRLTYRGTEGETTVKWASSRSCEGARVAVARLRKLPFPSVSFPGDPGQVVVDGTGYSISFPAAYGTQYSGQIELRSNVGTPLAAWIDDTLVNLQPCWHPSPEHR